MKRYIRISLMPFIIIASLVLCNPIYAEQILGIGDSIAHGYNGVGYTNNHWTTLRTALGLSTYYNGGQDGQMSAACAEGLPGLLSSHTPTRVYAEIGSNDVRWGGGEQGSPPYCSPGSLSTYLTNIGTMNTATINAGATFYMCQITPVSNNHDTGWGTNETGQQYTKLWNAALEEWCAANNVYLCPTYQDLCRYDDPAEDDDQNATYRGDGVHLSDAGYTRMGALMANAAVPTRKRIYGSTSYPGMSYDSWEQWYLTGAASISGDGDTGSLVLSTGDAAASPVFCMPTGTKTVVIYPTVASGSATIKYRTTATTNFDRNAAADWTTYSSSFSTTDQFIQVQLTSSSATVSEVRLDWSGTYSPPGSSSPTLSNVTASGISLQ